MLHAISDDNGGLNLVLYLVKPLLYDSLIKFYIIVNETNIDNLGLGIFQFTFKEEEERDVFLRNRSSSTSAQTLMTFFKSAVSFEYQMSWEMYISCAGKVWILQLR